MIVAIIGILAGALGLTSLIDNVIGSDITVTFLNGIWHVLQFLIEPILSLFSLIWDKLIELVRLFLS